MSWTSETGMQCLTTIKYYIEVEGGSTKAKGTLITTAAKEKETKEES